MKNIKIAFYKNDIIEDSFHLYNGLTNTITLKNLKDTLLTIIYDDFIPKNLKIQVIQSDFHLVEEYRNQLEDVIENFDIDQNSKVIRLGFYMDLTSACHIRRMIQNQGYYQNIQLDLCNVSIDLEEKINLLEPNSNSFVQSAVYGQNQNHKNYTTLFNHQAFLTTSDCKIYGVCNDFAQMSITTDAYIKNGARQSKAKQEGRIINLTKQCKGVIYPDLHIDENDVEASHSCSVGSVNLDHLYYLQTRGFSKQQGENLLIKSYFTPIIHLISDEQLKEQVQLAIQKRIG